VSKIIAIALLVMLAGDSVLPALLAGGESDLPACCRRDGKHHCAMLEMLDKQQDSAGPAWKTAASKCPMFPRNSRASFTSQATPPPAAGFGGLISSPSAVKAQTEVLFHISHSRTRQKRGPPALV
jgi:hypothetical protein